MARRLISTVPTSISTVDLSKAEEVKKWLLPVLKGADMPYPNIPATIFINNRPFTLLGGYWELSGTNIYLATDSAERTPNGIGRGERLGILAVITKLFFPKGDEEIEDALARAIGQHLMGEYSYVERALASVVGEDGLPKEAVTQLAFCDDGFAALVPDGEGGMVWQDNQKRAVSINDKTKNWTVVQL